MIQIFTFLVMLFYFSYPVHGQSNGIGYVKQGDEHVERHDQVIVFIHGLSPKGGDNAVSTWTADGVYWPEKTATDDVFRDVDVFVASYDSSAWDDNSFASVTRSLRQQLLDAGIHEYSRIFFVAHSLGGIALRQVLIGTNKLSDKTNALFMFAVPQNGSALADVARYVVGRKKGTLVKTLTAAGAEDDDSPISRLKSDWIRKRMNIPTYCGFETEDYSGFPYRKIVQRSSAEALCTHDLVAFERDHATIVHAKENPDSKEIADPHLILRYWYADALKVNGIALEDGGLVAGLENYDERDIVIANCPGDQGYSAAVIEKIRQIVFNVRGKLESGVSRAMPQVWRYPDYSRYLWNKHTPKFVVVHYSCFEGMGGDTTVRDGNFSAFAKDMLAASVNVVTYSRTFREGDRLTYICDRFHTSSLLNSQSDSARVYMYTVKDGSIIGGQDERVNIAFGTAVSEMFQGRGSEHLANMKCR